MLITLSFRKLVLKRILSTLQSGCSFLDRDSLCRFYCVCSAYFKLFVGEITLKGVQPHEESVGELPLGAQRGYSCPLKTSAANHFATALMKWWKSGELSVRVMVVHPRPS